VAQQALCRAERTRLIRQSDPGLWENAAAQWRALGQPYPAAYARWRQAEALMAARHARAEAAAALGEASEIATSLGAAPLVAEISALARAARLGGQAGEPSPQPPPVPGEAAGLTRRELEVLELLAEGLTNREIAEKLYISRKTAGVHVSHILRKLDANNRGTAAATAHRLGLVDSSPHAR
jgi:DNA-binding NarL/FixJ family response regulator